MRTVFDSLLLIAGIAALMFGIIQLNNERHQTKCPPCMKQHTNEKEETARLRRAHYECEHQSTEKETHQ